MVSNRKHHPDYLLILGIAVLLVLGLVVVYSISPVLSHKLVGDVSENYFLFGQLRNVGLAVVIFLITSNMVWWRWRKFLTPLVVVAAIATLMLFIPALAITEKGATRWIGIGSLSFQPVELVKLALVVGGAHYLSKLNIEQFKERKLLLWPSMALLGVVSLLVMFAQKDLGTMVVIASIIVGTLVVAGMKLKDLAVIIGSGLVLGALSIALFSHRLARIATFLNPESDLAGSGYHLNQALIAIGSGGLFGLGLGKSVQVYGYLPEAANDSIFAIIAETFGFFGSLVVIGLLGFIIWRMIKIAEATPDRFGQLLVIGVAIWVGTQALVNITAMLGIIPLTGIPLPFLSYGGSSLVLTMAAVGIVVNVSKHTERKPYAHSIKRRRHGGSYYSTAGYRPGNQTTK